MLSRRASIGLLLGAYSMLGLLVASIGPALAPFAAQTGSAKSAVGGIMSVLSIASLASQLVAGPLADRLSPRPVLVGSVALFGAGMLGLALSPSLVWLYTMIAIAGLGHGSLVVSAHVLIAQLGPERKTALLSWLNVFFGLGAIAGPAVASFGIRALSQPMLPFWLGAGVLGLALLPLARLARTRPLPETELSQGGGSVYGSPLVWMLGGLLLVYVGVEVSLGGWIPEYMTATAQLMPEDAALVASGYWLALTAGRMLSALLGTRLGPLRLLGLSVGGSLVAGALLMATVGSVNGSVAALLLLGLMSGPVFPVIVATAAMLFPKSSGAALGLLGPLGNLGGVITPWVLSGIVKDAGVSQVASVMGASTVLMALAAAGVLISWRRRMRPALAA